jgi:hypothetical protein
MGEGINKSNGLDFMPQTSFDGQKCDGCLLVLSNADLGYNLG